MFQAGFTSKVSEVWWVHTGGEDKDGKVRHGNGLAKAAIDGKLL